MKVLRIKKYMLFRMSINVEAGEDAQCIISTGKHGLDETYQGNHRETVN